MTALVRSGITVARTRLGLPSVSRSRMPSTIVFTGAAAALQVLAALVVLVHVAGFSADEGFIDFDFATESSTG